MYHPPACRLLFFDAAGNVGLSARLCGDCYGRQYRYTSYGAPWDSGISLLREVEEPVIVNARYFLLELDPNAGSIAVSGFRAGEILRATNRYNEAEKQITESGGDAVLVSVDSLSALRRAYPNYFLDTRVFLDLLEETLREGI